MTMYSRGGSRSRGRGGDGGGMTEDGEREKWRGGKRDSRKKGIERGVPFVYV